MKKIISTFLVLAMFVAAIVGAVVIYGRLFQAKEELTPLEVTDICEQQVGEPFVQALIKRDVKSLSGFFRGEFDSALPVYGEWIPVRNSTFEVKSRTVGEDDIESSTDINEILGYLLDPLSGLSNPQIEFTVLDMANPRKNWWTGRMNFSGAGFDQEQFARKYSFEGDVIFNIHAPESGLGPSIRSWGYETETDYRSTRPIKSEIFGALKKELAAGDYNFTIDLADFDNDNDVDVAITFANGERAVVANQDDKFVDVTGELGLPKGASLSSAEARTFWVDFDRDGKLDLVSGNQLFKNESSTRFVDVTKEYFHLGKSEDGSFKISKFRRSLRSESTD